MECQGGEWSFKNSGSRKILVEFHGSRSLVFLAVMCVSQSRFLYEAVSESQFIARLRVFKSCFVRLPVSVNDFFSSLDIEFRRSNLQISEKELILTSPKLS